MQVFISYFSYERMMIKQVIGIIIYNNEKKIVEEGRMQEPITMQKDSYQAVKGQLLGGKRIAIRR